MVTKFTNGYLDCAEGRTYPLARRGWDARTNLLQQTFRIWTAPRQTEMDGPSYPANCKEIEGILAVAAGRTAVATVGERRGYAPQAAFGRAPTGACIARRSETPDAP